MSNTKVFSYRKKILAEYGFQSLLGTETLKDILKLATTICDLPIAYISLLDDENQYILSQKGIEMKTMPIEKSFCQNTILKKQLLIIENVQKDQRTAHLPLAQGEQGIQFYAGYPLIDEETDCTLGAFCVMDYQTRNLDKRKLESLQILASQVMDSLKVKRKLQTFIEETEQKGDLQVLKRVEALRKEVFDKDQKLYHQENEIAEKIKENQVRNLEHDRELQIIVDALPACVSFVDLNYCYQLNNSTYEKWFGFTKENLKGKHVKKVIGEEAFKNQIPIFNKAFSGEVVQFETLIPVLGKPHNLRVRYIPAFNVDNLVIGTYVFAEDISELKQIQTQLEKSNEGYKSFAYAASHDIKSPLRTIKNFSRFLKRDLEGKLDENETENLNFIIEAAQRLDHLTTDLLEFSKIGHACLEPTVFYLEEVLEIVKQNLQEKINVSGAKIEYTECKKCNKKSNHVKIKANINNVIQLFQNLISNGLKYQKPGNSPIIQIHVVEQEKDWEISIIDNGIGIAEKFLDKLFLPFTRFHTRTEYPGSGIGLATCQKIVEQYNSPLEVQSVLDQGSTFTFRLPKHNS